MILPQPQERRLRRPPCRTLSSSWVPCSPKSIVPDRTVKLTMLAPT